MSEPTLIPLADLGITKDDGWVDCTIGGIICMCGHDDIGMLDVYGDAKACEKCGRRFSLVVSIEVTEPN